MKWSKIIRYPQSLRQRLIVCFTILAMLPLLANLVYSFPNDRKQIIQNRDQIASMDIQQVTQEFDTILSGYEDVLYQLYTDEEIVELIHNLDAGTDAAVTRNQLRRKLHGVFWQKDYITSITIITQKGETAFYDRLSSSLQTNACMEVLGLSTQELYDQICAHKGPLYFPTRYATYFAGSDYYLFFVGHRIINEKVITKSDAVILMSIDAKLLQETLNKSQLSSDQQKYMLMLDEDGQILCYPDMARVGQSIYDDADSLTDFVSRNHELDSQELAVYYRTSSRTGWQLVTVLDCTSFTEAIDQRLAITLTISIGAFLLVILAVIVLTGRLTASIDELCVTMEMVSQGDLSIRAEIPETMTPEIQTLALGLNSMADQLQVLIKSQRDSADKIKNAEITALEAQLNPHFLYNTLDTINWMAIEQEQYPISNVVSALGKTLRYGIDNSNGIVQVRDEINWLKQYIFIHQNRLKNTLQCRIDVSEDAINCHVHKLLLQPFVENAVIHGSTQEQTECTLLVQIHRIGARLHILIADNGRGIPEQVLADLDTSQSRIRQGKRYHGMQNAMNRLLLYYGTDAVISVKSAPDFGTQITLEIPTEDGKEEPSCAL